MGAVADLPYRKVAVQGGEEERRSRVWGRTRLLELFTAKLLALGFRLHLPPTPSTSFRASLTMHCSPAMKSRGRYPIETLVPALYLLLTIAAATATGSENSAERYALLEFKNSVSDPAGVLSRWFDAVSDDHCSWPGVICDSSSRVVAVNVPAMGDSGEFSCSLPGPFKRTCRDPERRLEGKLSASLGYLTVLRSLSLPFHALSGEIPSEIWRLEHLEVLDLEGNSISGSLPSKFPLGLRFLNIGSNLIEGQIPPSLSSCVDLETLDLSGNQLNGTIPGSLGDLHNLRGLYLSFNRLDGSIPDEIGAGCWRLEHLDLSANLLVGGIPRNLGNCSELLTLLLFSNLLEDGVPSDLGRLRKIHVLDVSRNSLSGSVPSELGACSELSVLVLSNPFNPMPFLDDSSYGIDDSNCFEGGISENITTLPKLRVLWAPRASFESEIPSNWGTCDCLEMVNLGQNFFSGRIPKALGQCKSLKFLNFSSNKLTGWLSEELPVPCMDVFDVSLNQLSGSIPMFVPKTCPSSQFPQDMSSAYSSFFAHRALSEISIPSTGSSGAFVIYHNFGGNSFTGPLPTFPLAVEKFVKTSVYAFLADRNQLVGSLTDILFKECKDLNGLIVNFSNNLISGEVPTGIGSSCGSLVAFDVSGNRITGTIPASFGLLGSVVRLDLSRNRIHGQIPPSLGNLKSLEYLSLASNNLSGHIPAGFKQLNTLKVLDLSSNALSGEIPSGLVSLKNLSKLILHNNKLSGKIPSGFASVTSLSMFNVSFNNLSGALPLNGRSINCDAVRGNPIFQSCRMLSLSSLQSDQQGQTGDSQADAELSPASSSGQRSNSGFSSIEIASITSASAIVSVLLALIVLYVYTRKCVPRSTVQSSGRRDVTIFVDIGVPLTYESVVRATGSFNASNCIGSGGFGATYKAEISPGVLVAIKRLSIGRIQGVQQFHAEIKTLGRWRHSNLVTLIGYHVSEAEMFLIYNYLPGGNLEKFIQERSKRPMDWRMLHKIALDVARALAHLHDHCAPRILHRDVKPSNILLDNEFNAYLSDFGLARLLGNSETHATTGVAGTFGYVAPEYAMTCRVSDKADVYSYGVVLLELISDKKALDPSFSQYGNGFNIVSWACMLLGQGKAREFFTEGLWDVGPHDDLVDTLHLAVMCTVDSLTNRPTMKHVVQRLKQRQPPTC